MTMIQAHDLHKSFGPIRAVDGISFTVDTGEVLGFLGPNGAGKSTTMRILNGFLRPDRGTARVGESDVLRDPVAVRRILGYVPENVTIYGEMTVHSFLRFVCEARGIKGPKARAAVDRVVELCAIGAVYHQVIETLSKGYVRRVGLAQAFIHDPPALVLDEPTDGLDPNQKHEVRQLIQEMSSDKSIVISTHILEEVDALCTRAMIIAHGKVVADGTPQELSERGGGRLDAYFRQVTTQPPGGKP